MAALKPTCDRAAACVRTYVNSVNHGGPATNPENLPIFDVSVNLYYFMVCVITIARTSASIWNLDRPGFAQSLVPVHSALCGGSQIRQTPFPSKIVLVCVSIIRMRLCVALMFGEPLLVPQHKQHAAWPFLW